MGQKEKDILALFINANTRLSNTEIGERINSSDPSQYTKILYYFGYLEKAGDKFYRTEKPYDEQTRRIEDAEYVKDYQMVLNKIFAGSFLSNNLGHELINFIKDDDGQRYVYLNPWGKRGDEAANQTRYVFHIIESPIKDENGVYELVAVSEIDQDAETVYSDNREEEKANCPTFNGQTFYDIFHCGEDSDKAHVYTYKASRLLKPRNDLRIIIKVKREAARFEYTPDENKIVIELICNPQHNIAYADVNKRTRYTLPVNPDSDVDVLNKLFDYLVIDNDNLSLEECPDEQCLSVICDRTKLEDSTSNQIAYFLRRDKHLAYLFLHDFLGIGTVTEQETFEIIREKEHIDLLFVSQNNVIAVENKIDASITNVKQQANRNGKHDSQLSNYYKFITTKQYRGIPNKHFFVLAPEYNPITQRELDTFYESGDHYILKSYRDLYVLFSNANTIYQPLGIPVQENSSAYFLFKEFVQGIAYISWSKAKQRENTAFIRLKQRMKELEHYQGD